MASGDADRIEVMETSFNTKSVDQTSAINESDSEDDDRDKSSIAERNASYDVSMGGGGMPGGKVHKSDRKIGHRRVGVGGEITYKKIQTSQIMGSIQLGIQHAVGGLASKPERDLLMQDFMTVETTNFPHEGSNHTPAHHYSEFKFKTYAPIAFRYFRDLFGIQPDDFLMSMCSAPMRELSNPGASGSIFYLTEDDEFIVKTVMHKEGEFLQKLLPGYYMNLNQNPRTLLPKFFGLYCYQCNSKNVRLCVMNNLLPSVVKLHQKYDLKGSTYKRKASKSEQKKKSPTYKDLDFMEHHPEGIFLEADTYTALVKTIQRDCRVLESFKIMDYSLLVGVHNLDEASREKAAKKLEDTAIAEEGGPLSEDGGDFTSAGASGQHQLNRTRTTKDVKTKEDFSALVRRTQSINRQRLVAHSTAMESIQAESEPIDEEEDVPPGGIPARNARGERLLLFIGVIDILQSYRFRKKLEHTWKSMIHDGDTVSVHRPGFYAQRFQDFMAKTVFKKIPSPLKHSPSKRKSISRPLRPHEEIDTPGWRMRSLRIDGDEEDDKRPYFRTVPSRVSMRQMLKSGSQLSLTGIMDGDTVDYPVVLSDMNKIRTLELRQHSPEFPYGYPGAFPRRPEYASSKTDRNSLHDRDTAYGTLPRTSSRQSSGSFETRKPSESRSRGRLREQNSLADSGIQTDSGSNNVQTICLNSADTLNEEKSRNKTDEKIDDVIQVLPYIDDSSAGEDIEISGKYITTRQESPLTLSRTTPSGDTESLGFFERFKKAVVELFNPHSSSETLARSTSFIDIGSVKLEQKENLYKSQTLPPKSKLTNTTVAAKNPSPILEERRSDVRVAQSALNDKLLNTLENADSSTRIVNVESHKLGTTDATTMNGAITS